MINSWKTITRGSCVSKAWKPPSSGLILIYFKFRSKPSLIIVIWMDHHAHNKFFATKYCFLILGDATSFFFLIISLLFVFFFFGYFMLFCYYQFLQKLCHYYHFLKLIFLFMKIILYFHVPGCSGMFRNVPECSMFLVLSTPRFISPVKTKW